MVNEKLISDRGERKKRPTHSSRQPIVCFGSIREVSAPAGKGADSVLSQHQYFGQKSVGLRKKGLLCFQHFHEEFQVVGAFQAGGARQSLLSARPRRP